MISHSGGNETVYLDQTGNGGSWQLLASSKQFAAGTNGFVRLSNNSGESGRVVMADAVRFVYSPNQFLPPIVAVPPQSQSKIAGYNAVFTVTAHGATPLNYQWRFNGEDIPGAMDSMYVRAGVQPSDEGNYSVIVANSLGSVVSVNASLAVIVAPTIVAQPSSVTANHGGNAVLAVVAGGNEPLSYQWRKNGINLSNYGNVSGANSATLRLAGVAQGDAADYTVIVSNPAGSVTSSSATLTVNPAVLFSDDFESGNLNNWTAISGATSLANSPDQNHTANGSRSALLTSSLNKMYRNLGTELSGRAKATFWIYDDGGNQTRCFGEARAYSGSGYGNGSLQQVFAIGRYHVAFNNTGNLAGETVDTTWYQGRVSDGENEGWFNLNAPGAPSRSTGWHKFEIERLSDGSTIHFYVDGVLARTITGADYATLDSVTIGSIGAGSTPGNAWFDDVRVEAFTATFAWETLDIDGDGLFDWMELRETGTNPDASDISQITTVAQVTGAATNSALGNWAIEGSAIYALGVRGYVEYVINAPADDAYRIQIEGRERYFINPAVELPLIVSIDGEYLGRFNLPYGYPTNGLAHCFTPFIKAGPHTVRIFWDNSKLHRSLLISAVRLQSLEGPDDNGMKDWVENRLQSQSGSDFAVLNSAISPACIEGRGQFLSMMTVNNLAARHGAGHRWYANVPLSPNEPTFVAVSHQNGGLRESNEITWQVTNLLEADSMSLRKGDALILTAVPADVTSGNVGITVVGVTNYVTDIATPVAHRFDQVGTFTVTGTFTPATTTRSITVKVIDASFEDRAAALMGHRRYWNCTNLPPEIAFESDPRLGIAQVAQLSANARQYSLTNNAAEPRYVVARVGSSGPIAANTSVEGFRLFSGVETYHRLIQTYPDGSQLIETPIILSPQLPEVSVKLEVIVAGVTFDDGTITKILAPADFDATGMKLVRFIRGPGVQTSVCHTTEAYQGVLLIGWPTY